MAFPELLELCKYILVLVYGLFLSADIAGCLQTRRQRKVLWILCPVLLLVQGIFWLSLGSDSVRRLYPLITHLPLVLSLVFVLKQPAGICIVSVTVGYLCCQLPRWTELVLLALTSHPLIGSLGYLVSIFLFYFLLRRWFVRAARSAMAYSSRALLLFGSLPVAYYLFDYLTAVYFRLSSAELLALNEFLPTALIAFYVVFLAAYHVQLEKRAQAELQTSRMDAELEQSRREMDNLRSAQSMAAVYQHDMRHHLNILERYLASGSAVQAQTYIQSVLSNLDAVTLHRFCENETVNLLCSSFHDKAVRMGVRFRVDVKLPGSLPIPDPALCAMLSNGLENALHAAADLAEADRWMEFYGTVKYNKLLLEIRNPFSGELVLENGLPTSLEPGHGYGCRSIQSIATHYKGLCTFEPDHNLFTLRILLPLDYHQV